jgi:hypothetical protein
MHIYQNLKTGSRIAKKTGHSVNNLPTVDNILLMASTAETLSHHVALTVSLLKLLGFVVKYQKSQLNQFNLSNFWAFL